MVSFDDISSYFRGFEIIEFLRNRPFSYFKESYLHLAEREESFKVEPVTTGSVDWRIRKWYTTKEGGFEEEFSLTISDYTSDGRVQGRCHRKLVFLFDSFSFRHLCQISLKLRELPRPPSILGLKGGEKKVEGCIPPLINCNYFDWSEQQRHFLLYHI